jgi:hypothetical protein
MDVGDKVDKVARHESENGVYVGIGWAYQGVVDCEVGRREA